MDTNQTHWDNTSLIIVCGKICSGKNTFCESIAKTHDQIIVSDIVKGMSGALHRSDLTETASLDTLIAHELIEQIRNFLLCGRKVVVDGIRQKSIYDQVFKEFNEHNVLTVWLDVPHGQLLSRYIRREDKKDDISFTEAIEKDNILGLKELEEYVRSNEQTLTIKHYS